MKEFHILNLGAGVQSTALYLMFMRGDLKPQIDFAIFADTGDEDPLTYENLTWLQSLSGPTILVRSKGRLSEDLLAEDTGDGRFATIPAFTEHGGKVKRQCTKEYKTEVIERAIRRDILGLVPRQRMPKDVIVHQYIGISLDEAARAGRITDQFKRDPDPDDLEFAPDDDYSWAVPHFPLLDLMMTRENCEEWLKMRAKVPHTVVQSACKECPFRTDQNWAWMKANRPEQFAEAAAFDESIREPGKMIQRGLSEPLYLHRSCKPLALVQFDPRPDPRKAQAAINFSAECMGVCGV